MIPIFKVPFLSLISFSLLLSCSSNSSEIEKLRTENENLRNQIKEMEISMDNFHQRIIVVPKSTKIALGENYEATVFLTFAERKEPAALTLFDNSPHPKFSDTLKFQGHDGIPIIMFQPKETGHYNLRGNLTQHFMGQIFDWPYLVEFDVQE